MPVLTESRKTFEVKLPDSGALVQVYESPLAGDVLGSLNHGSVVNQNIDPMKIVVSIVKSWDFTDEDGKPSEVTVDNIKKLTIKDFTKLAEQIERVTKQESEAEKKS